MCERQFPEIWGIVELTLLLPIRLFCHKGLQSKVSMWYYFIDKENKMYDVYTLNIALKCV